MRGNSPVRFLGEGVLVTASPYPTQLATVCRGVAHRRPLPSAPAARQLPCSQPGRSGLMSARKPGLPNRLRHHSGGRTTSIT
jgi:hypothetical protein